MLYLSKQIYREKTTKPNQVVDNHLFITTSKMNMYNYYYKSI